MTPSTEVAAVQEYSPEVLALLQQQEEDLGDVQFQTPILKVCQALTKEVKEGDAEPGEFLNTLTAESYGTKVDFIVAYFQKGRAASSSDGRYYVAIGQDTIPESWSDLVGEAFVGTPFDEYPDAEEQYKKRVNAKEIEWGKGPQVSTTYNYTGLVLPEGADEDPDKVMPVRISFLRSTKSAHDKIMTLKKATLRGKAFWDVAFELSTTEKSFGRNSAHVVNVKKARDTTVEERTIAFELAQAVIGGRTEDNAEKAEAGSAKVAPEDDGGLSL